MPWPTGIAPVRAQVNANHFVGAHFMQGHGGDGMRQHPIHQQSAVDLHRQEHAGIGATGAHRLDQLAGTEDHTFAADEIGG